MPSNSQAIAAARQILGCYPTIPASDEQIFTAGLVKMLASYPPVVIDEAADPARGIAASIDYLSLAKCREWLDKAASHYERMRKLRDFPSNSFDRLPPPPREPGDLATVHVPHTHSRYAGLIEWSATANPRLWKLGVNSEGVPGIWVAFGIAR